MFHSVCGDRITLYNNNKTAKRSLSEFNHGLVFSRDALQNNYLFEVRIEKKVYAWSGGLEIGVTKCNPECIDIPANATDMKSDTWILSGSSVLKDGRSVLDIYGLNLNNIEEGDVVGVMRTDQDELLFSLNGECRGIAAYHIPFRVFAVIDLYGQVAQATIVSYAPLESKNLQSSIISNDLDTFDDSDITEGNSLLSNLVTNFDMQTATLEVDPADGTCPVQDVSGAPVVKIRFHSRCGTLAKISCNGRTAERLRPFDEFNNGVVITHRPLCTGELFEIRIDRLVEKWSGSIEVGITMHNPDFLQFPPTMTNLKTGTVMMSGCGILTNGKATKRDYGDFNLDELMVGDRIGLIRKPNDDLHYVINGLDQGVAASNVRDIFWGVVDLYGRTVKVTIVDKDEREEQNLITRRVNLIQTGQSAQSPRAAPEEDSDSLVFHNKCGTHVEVTNNCRTAYRPNALEDFNNGVVLTSRPLKLNIPFEVKLDKIVSKWAGSIEIGVTSHPPIDLEFPSTMTNIRSGTWMMTGNGVMHNGTTILDDYGINLDRLQVGDRVAVVIKDNGSLHLFVNGIDQGEVAANINSPMYGVIDLYGQAAQATIIEYDMLYCCNTPSEARFPLAFPSQAELRFHHVHGKNVRICNGGRTAARPQPFSEFTDAVVLSSRPLKTNEMFAIAVDKIVDRWSGSIEAGVTAIKLDDLELPATMTDLDHDTWMLSGSTVMKDSVMVKHGYALNLDTVQMGMIIGMMRYTDGSLHYYLDGVDQGEACSNVPSVVYPVIDLYGQCAQVSIVSPPEHHSVLSSNETTSNCADEVMQSIPTNTAVLEQPQKRFSQWCGKNIDLADDYTIATRIASHNHGLLFSNFSLESDKLYEMTVTKWSAMYAGSLSIGVTTTRPEKIALPPMISCLKPDVWYITGDEVWHNGRIINAPYCHNLHWLRRWSTVGVRVSSDGSLHFYINGQDQGVAACDLPMAVYMVVDLYGSVTEISLNREVKDMMASVWLSLFNMAESIVSPDGSSAQDTLAVVKDFLSLDDLNAERATMEFYLLKNFEKEKEMLRTSTSVTMVKEWVFFRELRGRNIRFLDDGRSAVRTESYNQGVIILSRPLERDVLFQVTIDNLNTRWVSSLMIGVLCSPVTRSLLPVTAFGFKKDAWIIAGNSVYHNGHKIKSRYGPNLESISVGQRVGIMVDTKNQLKLFIDGNEQGVAASNIPPACFVVLDLYGQCKQLSIVNREPVDDMKTSAAEPSVRCMTTRDGTQENVNRLASCEKADFEQHEKESPSDDDISLKAIVKRMGYQVSKSDDEVLVSRSKVHKTNENISVVASHSSQSLISQTESHMKLNKTNENNAVFASCSTHSAGESVEFPTKMDKTNENNSISEMQPLTCENVGKLAECCGWECKQTQNVQQMSTTNCDHKTSLNIANAMYIQAAKSGSKTKSLTLPRHHDCSSLNDRPISLTKQDPNCEYRIRCSRFRNFLGLPAGFFSSDSSIICYCNSCYPSVTHECKGEPPSSYSVPRGWCKFPLKKHLMTNNVDALTLEKWHVAFFGVTVGSIRRILDSGQLIASDKLKSGCCKLNKLKDGEYSKFQIILSPLIKHATNLEFDSKYLYMDQKTKVSYLCTAAFQVLVRPTSYKVGAPLSEIICKSVDQHSQSDSIEWVIKEKESIVLSAVLFKLDLC